MGYRDAYADIERGAVKSLYLWYGDEEFVKDRALEALCQALVAPGMESLNRQDIDGEEAGIDAIIHACDTLPFIAERRLVVVRDPYLLTGRKGTQAEQDRFTAYLAELPQTVCLVLVLRAGHNPDKRKAIYKAVAKSGGVVEFALLNEDERARWVKRELVARRNTMDARTLRDFLSRVGATMRQVSQELTKLLDYAGEGAAITGEMVGEITIPTAEERIFDMLDAVGRRQAGAAMVSLDHLLAAGEEPLMIVTMLARQFRMMLLAGELRQRGVHPDRAAKEMGVAPWLANKYADQSSRFAPETLMKGMATCVELNHGFKNGIRSPREAMEVLIAGLCQG